MQHRRLGRSGLQVSRLALGTLTWGAATDRYEARDLLTGFVDGGGTLVDTSPGYGDGAAESVLGALLVDTVDREDLVIATSAGLVRDRERGRVDCSRSAMLRTLEESLGRLGTDHVDLWQVHAWDGGTPVEETLSALEVAVGTGRARYVGLANHTGWQTARAATWQQAVPGRTPLVSAQVEYSLLARDTEDEVLPAARALDLGLLAWSPLGRGVLTGKYRSGTPADSRVADQAWSRWVGAYLGPEHDRVVEAVVRAAEGLGWTPLEVALTWVRDRPGVTAAVVGPRTSAQLRQILPAEERTLPDEIAAALDDVSSVAAS